MIYKIIERVGMTMDAIYYRLGVGWGGNQDRRGLMLKRALCQSRGKRVGDDVKGL